MFIDARGIGCPKPVIMAEEALSQIAEGAIEILVDNEASVGNLTRFATKNGFHSETSKENSCWRLKIVKGYACKTGVLESGVQSSETKEKIKDILLIVGTDIMGKEEELGKILIKAFFETMKVTKEVPHTIFFLNAGVKLTTINEDIIAILKDIETMGVEIFSCGTCLKHFNFESELKVGYRGTTNHIVEGIKDFKKTVWIG
ncbi:MAG: sulfurtransferase-like selenium metabolism protein YedF [Thermodesulfovibrio sp.]|nr:sulfurtransferase-like selenium metabolism protein YedF [Thermodesulfovibrio sp.]